MKSQVRGLVSIIIPFYRNEKTIERCLRSAQCQTYPHLEILAVSDGSPDSSADIVRAFAEGDSRIKLIEAKHGGVSAARNRGLREAHGEYIQFIDADDDVEPDMTQTLLSLLQKENANVAACRFTHPVLRSYAPERVYDCRDFTQMRAYYLETFTAHLPWNKLYRRRAIRKDFIEGLAFSEDGMFCLANMPYFGRVATTSRELYHYFAPQNEGSSCISEMAQTLGHGNSFWYHRLALLPTSRNILSSYLTQEQTEDLAHIRLFDFLIWECFLYASHGADFPSLVSEVESVMSEPDFTEAMKRRGPYGVCALTPLSPSFLPAVQAFTGELLTAFRETQNASYNLFDLSLCLFAHFFLRLNGAPCREEDNLVSALMALKNQSTPEARYVSELLSRRQTG